MAAATGKNTFLEIYGAAATAAEGARATPLPANDSSEPRTIANTSLLSHAHKTEQQPSAEQQPSQQPSPHIYTTAHSEKMATYHKTVPPHRKKMPSNRWPSKKDFPKPDQKRWTTNDWDTQHGAQWSADKQNSWDSQDEWANTGVNLTDWNGGWAPAPLDWDSRPAFRPEQSEAQIQRWLDNSETSLTKGHCERGISVDALETLNGVTYAFTISDEAPEDTKVMGDIVPRCWIPVRYGREDPALFWEHIMASNQPKPQDPEDLDGARPWWDLLQSRQFLEDLSNSHPDIAAVDPDETTEERLLRENDDGGINHLENRRKYSLAIQKARNATRQRKEQREKVLRAKVCNSDRARDNKRLRPGVPKMFIRSARPEDMADLRDIYNHYARNSCTVPESEDCTRDDMVQRYSDALFSKLPFIVACEKGQVITAPKKKSKNSRAPQEDIVLPDKIIGFAVADDYNDMKGMYRFTAQVEVFTHNAYYMKGVASCLMDKMTALLDPDYLERGGYEVRGDELEGKEPQRVIKTILMHSPFEKAERVEWMNRWLGKSLDFELVGKLHDVGTKLNRSIGLAIFQRDTGAVLDHANPPAILKT